MTIPLARSGEWSKTGLAASASSERRTREDPVVQAARCGEPDSIAPLSVVPGVITALPVARAFQRSCPAATLVCDVVHPHFRFEDTINLPIRADIVLGFPIADVYSRQVCRPEGS